MTPVTYEELLIIDDISQLSENEQIDVIGNLFDFSFDNQKIEGLEKSFQLIKQIQIDTLSEVNKTVLFYDISNGWSYLRKLKYFRTSEAWSFQMEELSNEIYYLRKAISSAGFKKIQKERQCQILTNLGNSFSFIGRFVEAQAYWDKAIETLPLFSMAIGNKGFGMFHYGQVLFDDRHKAIFFNHSYHYLKRAIELKQFLEGNAANGFGNLISYIEKNYREELYKDKFDLNNFDLGENIELSEYRRWCLLNKLYINPLNDLGNYTNASQDCLNLSSIKIKIKAPPTYFSLYNQIKQEYATARYLFYNSTDNNTSHFSDEDVVVLDTMETAVFSFNMEQTKLSFRISYSILDKIAYLLNDYLNIGKPLNKVSFRSIWLTKDFQRLHPIFDNSDNWALRGLYWLSKDIYEKEFKEVIEPEAQEISKIRNHLEHKCLKIIDNKGLYERLYNTDNDIAHVIERTHFENATLNMLKLTRAAIIYLSIAIDHEEKKKPLDSDQSIPFQLNEIPKWRRT